MGKVLNISPLQVILLLVGGRIMSAFTYTPTLVTPPANQDVWIVAVLAMVYTFIISWPLLFLSKKFEGLNLVEWMEKVAGKPLGKLLAIAPVFVLLFFAEMELVLLDVFIKTAIMPETPDNVIMVFMLAPCVYAVYKGIEAIARLAEMFIPLILMLILFFTGLSYLDMNFKVFLPVLADTSLGQLNYGAFNIASRYTEIIVLCMLAPHISKKGHLHKIFTYSVVIATIFLVIIVMTVQAVLGIVIAREQAFPYFVFVQQIQIFDFLERIESLNALAWFVGWFLKFTLYFYLGTEGVARILNLKSSKVLFIPTAVLMYFIAQRFGLLKAVTAYKIVSYQVLPNITILGIFIAPLIIYIIYFFRRKALRTAEGSGSKR